MNANSSAPEYAECLSAAQIRVLWIARTPPNLSLLNSPHVGLTCLHLAENRAQPTSPVEPLTDDALTAIANAHLLFVVSDFESEARAQQIDLACKQANRSSTFRIHLDNDAEAVSTAVRSMTEMLNVYSFIGIDTEDVQGALSGPGSIVIATAVASGEGRAPVAASQVLAQTNLDNCTGLTIHGVCLVISAAPHKLQLSECTVIRKLVAERLSTDTGLIYGMNNDASLGDAIRATIFVNAAPLPDDLKEVVDLQIGSSGFGTSCEYVRDLLLTGAQSAHTEPVDATYFDRLRKSITGKRTE